MTAASQDPSSNPFEVLGVPAGFEMDEAQLHRQFVLRAAAAHPDRFTDPFEQAQAAQRAATINDAYQVLRDPQARAEALIELLGGPAKEQDKSLPPDLLSRVMQTRLRLEEAIEEQDTATLKELTDWAYHQHREHLKTVADLFRSVLSVATASGGDSDQESQAESKRSETLKQIRLELNALRYIQRMIEQLPVDHAPGESR